MKGLSMEALCFACDGLVSKQSISKYEKGAMKPSSKVLIALSNALEVSPDYFLKSGPIVLDSIEFRKKKNFPEKALDSLREKVRYRIEKYIEIEDILGINPLAPKIKKFPVKGKEDVYHAAREVRQKWRLGEDGIVNVISVLEENGIKMVLLKGIEEFEGMCCTANGMPVIVFSHSPSVERDRFTVLHELGHLVLDFDPSVSDKEQENLCHFFASEMLIPRTIFLKIVGNVRKNMDISELKNIQSEFGISVDALMFKARENGVMSENSYKNYCLRRRQKKLEIADQSNALVESPTRFERLVLRGIASEVISLSKGAELLDKPLGSVKEQVSLV